MMPSKRIEYIDAIKGFAAICVIIGHVCDGYLQSGLFFCYLLAALFIKIKINPYLLLGIGLACNIGSNFFGNFNTVSEIPKILYYFIIFMIGCFWKKRTDLFEKHRKKIYIFSGCSIVLLAVVWPFSGRIDKVPVANVIIAVGISFLFIFLFEKVKFLGSNRFLQYCGKRALEIYVIHCFFTAGFRAILARIGITSSVLSLIINTVLSLFLSLAFDWIVKKIKLHSLLFKPYTVIKKRETK